MSFIDVFVTCPDRAVAVAIARECIAERLAACANIGSGVTSIYRWKDVIEETDEIPLLLKTRASAFDALAARIRALHPYETPCIIATEITSADADYAAWLKAQTV